ncbi:RNase III domain-containing protein [Arthroderma uncinatum]|uniref:RNase III domain-containing protein n=1 Tax=Arthroderma uncinatum TaxID=74035 RepID=UPI00144AB21A|nr:RNase III domain-containing protein [Arthroderma uncinatum]KAF3479763.1 RNase III domain-containing protein [Arthroderma uncinatum]
MAFKIAPIQTIAGFAQPARRRAPRFLLPFCSQSQSSSRRRISSTHAPQEQQTVSAPTPRWQQTPPAMKAPVRLRTSSREEFKVNSDPAVLDNFYVRVLGQDGDKLLSEEVKWQAVTHKSFDQGRRGFNDRLAYFGKQVIMLQASLALIQNPTVYAQPLKPDSHGRQPYESPALRGLEVLSQTTRSQLTRRKEMSALARHYGISDVLRWLPRKENLTESGVDTVYTHAMYAVIGAVALENGSKVANEITREKILKPLGFKLA